MYFWLRCYAQAFSSCGEQGLLFVGLRGLLVAVASLVAEHGLQAHGLSSCGSQALECRLSSCGARAQLLCGMWDLPRPGLEPVSPALAGGFLTTAPPGKSPWKIFLLNIFKVSFLSNMCHCFQDIPSQIQDSQKLHRRESCDKEGIHQLSFFAW